MVDDCLVRNFSPLSDIEFEELCADLLRNELGKKVERFAAGRDKGIDLRWDDAGPGKGIGQCKHYVKSTFSQLLASAKLEVPKVTKLKPNRYLFFASQSLNVTQKEQIYGLFQQWMTSEADVYSADDIDALISKYPDVETRHVKLWLNTGSQLFLSLHAGIYNQSRALAERATDDMKRFVYTVNFDRAQDVLTDNRVCLIAGAPGVGKTMLAHALIAAAVGDGYEPIEISDDIKDAWDLFDREKKQFFLYDDFLGEIAFMDRLGKKEDQRLVEFIREVSRSKKHRFVLTTREYILRDAESLYPKLVDIDDEKRLVLSIPSYSRMARGQILYNHIWHSALPDELKQQFTGGGWKAIVDHPGFSPRLIRYATTSLLQDAGLDYLEQFESVLSNPTELWSTAYDAHLKPEQQLLLRTLCSFDRVSLDVLRQAVVAQGGDAASFTGRRLNLALKSLDQTFISTSKRQDVVYVTFHSPAVREFMLNVLREDDFALISLVQSAVSVGQLWHLSRAGASTKRYNTATQRFESTTASPLQLHKISVDFVASVKRLMALGLTNFTASAREESLATLTELPVHLHPELSWWQAQLKHVAAEWNEGNGSPSNALIILQSPALKDVHDPLPENFRISVRELLVAAELIDDAEWSAAVDIYSDVLEEDIPDKFTDDYCEYVADEIRNQGLAIGNMDELKDLADRLGLSDAQSRLAEHEELIQEKADYDDDGDGYRGSRGDSEGSSGHALEDMFNRLA